MNRLKINLIPILYVLIIISLCFTEGIGIIILSIPITLLIIFILSLNSKKVLEILEKSFKYLKEVRWLLSFFIVALIGAFFNIMTHHIEFPRFLLSIIVTYILSFAVFYLIGLFLPFIFSNKKIVKLFIISLLIIMIAGFIEFIIFSLHIYSFEVFYKFITGRSNILCYKMGFLPRIQSLFQEPSHYAWFLVCLMPLTMSISKSNKVIHINIQNIIIKMLFPIVFISLLLTRSPINLIISVGVYIFCLLALNKINIKKIIKIACLIFAMLLIISILLIKVELLYDSITSRIISGMMIFKNFDLLIHVESSFATRIISYVNMFIIYLHHPIFGTGCGSLATELYKQLPNSPLPLTGSLSALISQSHSTSANPSIFFKVLVDTGSLGFICFAMFIYNIYKKINKKFLFINGDIYNFLNGIKYTLLIFVCLSIYDSTIACHYFWCLFGVISGLYLKNVNKFRKNLNN